MGRAGGAYDDRTEASYTARLGIASLFNRVSIAPRFRISNLKYEISNRTSAAR